jgi:hypothetical protein
MKEVKYRPQDEVDIIKKRRFDQMVEMFKEHELEPEMFHNISLLRGHVISLATQLEEMVEAITEFYYLRGDIGLVNKNFQISYFGPDKGLKQKVENLIMIIKTTRPIFAKSANDYIIDLEKFASIRNEFAHWYAHKSNQVEGLIVLHAQKRDGNKEKIKVSKVDLESYIDDLFKKWLPVRHMLQQFFELVIYEQDKIIDKTTIDEIINSKKL